MLSGKELTLKYNDKETINRIILENTIGRASFFFNHFYIYFILMKGRNIMKMKKEKNLY